MKPYVGVTGFTDIATAWIAYKLADGSGILNFDHGRLLMLGTLVSEKTLNRLPNNHPGKYPPVDRYANASVTACGCLNLVHYSSSNTETLSEQLWRLAGFMSEHGPDGIQLNVAWPAPSCVIQAMNRKPQIQRVVLQIRPDMKWESERGIAKQVASYYRDFITDVLIDGSGGRGVLLDPDRCASVLEAIDRECPWVGIGVAGGLCAETLDVLKPLLARWPRLSWDAEGRLMTDEKLDMEKVEAYLRKSGELLYGRG